MNRLKYRVLVITLFLLFVVMGVGRSENLILNDYGNLVFVEDYDNPELLCIDEAGAVHIGSCEGPLLVDLLIEAREYIRDGDENYLDGVYVGSTTLEYRMPHMPHRTLKDDAEAEISKAEAAKDRLEKETALRRRIDKLINQLKGDHK